MSQYVKINGNSSIFVCSYNDHAYGLIILLEILQRLKKPRESTAEPETCTAAGRHLCQEPRATDVRLNGRRVLCSEPVVSHRRHVLERRRR